MDMTAYYSIHSVAAVEEEGDMVADTEEDTAGVEVDTEEDTAVVEVDRAADKGVVEGMVEDREEDTVVDRA
jgi:hypothetical protein